MNYGNKEIDIIVADSLGEINYRQKRLLLASLNENVSDGGKYTQELIKTLGEGVYNKIRKKFCEQNYRDRVLKNLNAKNIDCITCKSAEYPARLLPLPAPPLVLYARGDTGLLKDRLFGVVGSRRTPAQTIEQCKKFCSALCGKLTLVTGVADGADSAVMRGALKSGKIICVLPGGHDRSGAADLTLLKEVEKRGLTISEFPPETRVQRYTFVVRNRIIAGLSEGVLVVSAGKVSGALSTAGYATEYSKHVFAFPYGVGAECGEGCNDLIKHGAYLCDSVDDVFGILGIELKEEKSEVELTGDERTVYNEIKLQGEMHAEQIADVLGGKLTYALSVCSMLEIKGLIIRTGGNKFAALQII